MCGALSLTVACGMLCVVQVAALEGKLAYTRNAKAEVEAQLAETQGKLAAAEAEVARLAGVQAELDAMEAKHRKATQRLDPPGPQPAPCLLAHPGL